MPMVSKTDIQTLNEYVKPIIQEGLGVQGMDNLNAYLYDDEMLALQGLAVLCGISPYQALLNENRKRFMALWDTHYIKKIVDCHNFPIYNSMR